MCRKKAHGNEAVARADVGDKLQSCELKRFKASAKGDKSTPPCSTNHCSLDGHAPGGRAAPWLHATPNADHALQPDARHIGMKNTVFFAWDRTKKKTIHSSVPSVPPVTHRETKTHKSGENFHIYQA